MHVLLISSYYWPELAGNAPFVTDVAEHLAAQGNRVTVATGFPHYPEWRRQSRALSLHEEHNGVVVRRRQHLVPRRHTAATRAAYDASLLAAALAAVPYRRRPDAVIAFCPSLGGSVAAAAAARYFARPYGIVFQDLVGLGVVEAGFARGRAVASAVARFERSVARGAARIGVIAESFASHLLGFGIPAERIELLRNWSRHRQHPVERTAVRAEMGWGEHDFVCLHAGNIGRKQGLENVVEAAELLGPDARIVFVGDGNERPAIEQLAVRRELANVSFLGMQEESRYAELLRAADVLLVNLRPTVDSMALPSKLGAYLEAGRPIVAAVRPGSETARIVESSRAGILVEPGDPAALADSLRKLRHDRELGRRLAAAGRAFARRHLDRTRALSRYERFVHAVAAAR